MKRIVCPRLLTSILCLTIIHAARKNAQEVLCDTLLREVEALQRTEVPSPLGKHDSRKQKGISRGRSSNTAGRTDYSSTSENDNKPKRKWPKWLRLGSFLNMLHYNHKVYIFVFNRSQVRFHSDCFSTVTCSPMKAVISLLMLPEDIKQRK